MNRTDRPLPTFGYSRRVALLACPFCRELFEDGEAKACPVCQMPLAKLHHLPPSIDAMHDDAGVPTAPEIEALPLTYLGRGKGPIAFLALAGLAFFFLPWVELTMPYVEAKTAFDLARKIGWLWGVCAAWAVLVPTVLSRRSILQMRGARVATAFLSAIPAVAIGVLLAKPPHGGLVPVRYTWAWPMWATLSVSLAATLLSIFWLGGSMQDIAVKRGSSKGQALH